jgi:nitrate reductase gamma subunit
MRSERGGVLVFFGLVLAFVVLALLVVVQIIRYGLAVADLQAARVTPSPARWWTSTTQTTP